MVHKKHFGVYGVAYANGHLLCIKKKIGPYKNRFDVPGGSQKESEGLTETLVREIMEETGYGVSNYGHSRCYDVFVEDNSTDDIIHHIFVLYTIKVIKKYDKLPELTHETNDSAGPIWVEISDLTAENTSPLVARVLEELKGESDETLFDVKKYKNWIISKD